MAPRTELGVYRKHGVVKKYGTKIDHSKITDAIRAEIAALKQHKKKVDLDDTPIASPAFKAKYATKKKVTFKGKATIARAVDAGMVPTPARVIDRATVVDATKKAVPATVIKSLVGPTKKVHEKKTDAKNGLDNQETGVAAPNVNINVLVPKRKKGVAVLVPKSYAKQAQKKANADGTTSIEDANRQYSQTYHNTLVSLQPVYKNDAPLATNTISNLIASGVPAPAEIGLNETEALKRLDKKKAKNTTTYLDRLAKLEQMALKEDQHGGKLHAAIDKKVRASETAASRRKVVEALDKKYLKADRKMED